MRERGASGTSPVDAKRKTLLSPAAAAAAGGVGVGGVGGVSATSVPRRRPRLPIGEDQQRRASSSRINKAKEEKVAKQKTEVGALTHIASAKHYLPLLPNTHSLCIECLRSFLPYLPGPSHRSLLAVATKYSLHSFFFGVLASVARPYESIPNTHFTPSFSVFLPPLLGPTNQGGGGGGGCEEGACARSQRRQTKGGGGGCSGRCQGGKGGGCGI
jgi:hypothetical protein